MKIINHTRYDQASVRRLIREVAKLELDPGQLPHTVWTLAHYHSPQARVGFRQARQQWPAWRKAHLAGLQYNHGVIRINAKAPNAPFTAMLIAHEMAEMRGLKHKQMRRNRYGYVTRRGDGPGGWREVYAWAAGPEWAIVPKSKPVAPPSSARRAQRLRHAESKVTAWTRRVKLANTMLKKWRQRVRRLTAKVRSPIEAPSNGEKAETTA